MSSIIAITPAAYVAAWQVDEGGPERLFPVVAVDVERLDAMVIDGSGRLVSASEAMPDHEAVFIGVAALPSAVTR
jgi:hypothetical protein